MIRRRAPGSATVPLVRRSGELRRILAALERVAGGRGGSLLFTGQVGAGKSRLAREAMALAGQRGFLTLEGAAYPLHGDLAYAPVLEAVGAFLADVEPVRQAALVRGLPDLGRLFAGLHLPPPEPLGDPALERTRLFEAVFRLLGRLAEQAPLVLFIDDLHWADAASLELLHYVARGLADRRVLLLGAYRSDETRTPPGLRSLVRSLQRLGLAEELAVSALPPDAVAALATALLEGDPPAELLDILHARAAGIPLFVTALIRDLLQTRGLFRSGGAWVLGGAALATVPSVVRDLALGRLEHLYPTERALLELVMVADDAAGTAVLRHISGVAAEALVATLRWLGETGLLVEHSSGSDLVYRAAHPLIAEVTYGEIPETARRRLHAAVAAALEEFRPNDLERLAHHYRRAAGDAEPGRALEVLVAAGRRAQERYADQEAADHFAAAVALARTSRPDLCGWLLEQLGQAHSRAGQLEAAVAAWSEAVGECERAGDRRATGRLRGLLALAEWDQGRFQAAEAHLEAGLDVLADADGAAELTDLHYIRLQLLARLDDVDGVEREAEILLALAERSGTQQAVAAAHQARVDVAFLHGRYLAARENAQEALAVAEAAGLILLTARAHRHLSIIALCLGDHRLAREHSRAELELARRAGVPTLELGGHGCLLLADVVTGAWDDALRGADSLLALGHRVGTTRALAAALSVHALVHTYRGKLDEAAASLAEARAVFGRGSAVDRHVFDMFDLIAAIAALAAGDTARARAAVARTATKALILLPGLGFPVLGEAQVASGDLAGALATARRLSGLGPAESWPVASADWVEGLARTALGERPAALTCLQQAAERLDELGIRFQAAHAWLAWAGTAAGGDAPQQGAAAEAARRSLAVFDELGARPSTDRARRLLRALGERPAARPRRAVSAELSDRELEVARLVAVGLGNAEIAARLFISPRTVTTHLQHVYARLGLSSRTALTRWVLERGLAVEDT